MSVAFNPVLEIVNPSCVDCPIREKAVCAYCEPDELSQLDAIKSYKSYESGDMIMWAGEDSNYVGSVVSGVATLSQTLEDGRRQMVGLLLPSDFIGRPGRGMASFDVEAKSDVTICRFERKPFERLLSNMPHLSERLLDMSLDELDAAREWMMLLGRKTAREKIASLLTIVAKRLVVIQHDHLVRSVSFELTLTREAMAEYLGLTLETVSRQMNALAKENIISLEKRRRITIPDFSRLMSETGDSDLFPG